MDLGLEEFLYCVKKELLNAQVKHEGEDAFLVLESVELATHITVEKEAEGKVGIKVVEGGMKWNEKNVHEIKLAFRICPPCADTDGSSGKGSGGGGGSVRFGGPKFR